MSESASKPFVDCHFHGVNFFQHAVDQKEIERTLTDYPNAKLVIMGLPVRKKWAASESAEPKRAFDDNGTCYYYSYTDQIVADIYENLPEDMKNRVTPLLCGFNPTDKYAVYHVEQLLDKHSYWAGVGEILLRHDHLTNLVHDELAFATHDALKPIYELCSKRNLPFLIHQNSNSQADNAIHEYIDEVEEVLKEFPKLRLVWAHGGMSPRSTHPNYHREVESLLGRYPNFYIDVSWTLATSILNLPNDWIPILEEFSDRMMLGTDAVASLTQWQKELSIYEKFAAILSDHAYQNIAFETANKVYFKR